MLKPEEDGEGQEEADQIDSWAEITNGKKKHCRKSQMVKNKDCKKSQMEKNKDCRKSQMAKNGLQKVANGKKRIAESQKWQK